jgi:hypothetical protein
MDSQIFLGGSESTTLEDLNQALGKETTPTTPARAGAESSPTR